MNADPSDPASTHIPIFLYAGDEDNVVTSVSALDVFPAEYTGVISGDHSSIIQPAGVEAESYRALRRHIMHVIEETDDSNGTDELEQATAFCTSDVTDIPTLVEKAEDYARQGQNALAEATFLQASSTGDLYALQAYSRFQRQQGQLDRSIATSSLVIEKLAGAEDSTANRVMRSRVLSTIGISQRNLGKLQQSERSLREAASASRGDEDDVAELDASAYALDNLGLTLMRSAEIRAAKGAFYDARKIRENLPDKSKLAPSFLNIARIELREGNFDAAEKDCAMAISLWDPDKDAASLAAGYSLQGEIAYAAEDYDSAEKSFSEALRLNNSIGRGISIALTQQQLSRISLMRGDFVAAEAHARKSLENCVLASNTEGQVGAKQLLGRIASSNGDRPGAVNMLEDCVTSYRELGNLTGEAWSSFYLAEVLYQLGRADSGAARLQRATALADWITNASLRRAVETFSPG